MDVLISITGTQILDNDSDTIELTTAGEMERTQEGFLLRYPETSVTGMPGTMTTLHVTDRQVLLERSGALNSLMVLEKRRRHQSRYETPYGSLMMGVYTEQLSAELDDQGGRLQFVYTMDMNGQATGRHDIQITVKRT